MNDVETVQKELEDKLFDFIEENFGKKRHECFNQVMSFINNNNLIIDNLTEYDSYIQDLEIDNEELESNIEDLYYSFDSLKSDCEDNLEEIESMVEDIISNNELDSVMNKLKELKELISYRHKEIENIKCC